jgi:hypothetical protein
MRSVQRILLGSLSVACLSVPLSAQNVRMNFFSGYTYQDKFPISGTYNGFSYSEGRIADGQHYGGSLEFDIRPNKAVELLYQQQDKEGYLRGGLGELGPYDVTMHYIMLGGLGRLPFNDAVSGYGGMSVGCGWMTGENSATKFAFGGKLGLQFNISDVVGIKAGAQILSPVQGFGGGFYFGTGGAGAGVSTYSSVYQFAWTGGLCFTLPRQGSSSAPPSRSAAPAPPPSGGGMPPPPPPMPPPPPRQ